MKMLITPVKRTVKVKKVRVQSSYTFLSQAQVTEERGQRD